MKRLVVIAFLMTGMHLSAYSADHSIARIWNEVLLQSIREDYARPTVHARNLFHTSVVMYDSWAVYDSLAIPYFLGQTNHGFRCPFDGLGDAPDDIQSARETTLSYAVYRLLRHRFANVPNDTLTLGRMDSVMVSLGYDPYYFSMDYTAGPAALGNYLANYMINYGLQDGANEHLAYENTYYKPINPNLIMAMPGNPDMKDPNRWQPLTLKIFIDQSGNVIPINTPDFLSPEWGNVLPFAMDLAEAEQFQRDSGDYKVYNDPGPPPYLDTTAQSDESDHYKWGFEMVSVWSSHLDPTDTTRWDISPGGIGNIQEYPEDLDDYDTFYDWIHGGDNGQGHDINPVTGQAYDPQMVKRADYGRVLAEFWADGPDSETPPGHWYTILNYVNDHPLLEKKFKGAGNEIDNLEWDVKSYFVLGGAMHDVAISAWGIKGYYDYIRPVSSLRYMAGLGQSSDSTLPNYHVGGVRLSPGYIELVQMGDPLEGSQNEHVNKIKVKAWKGPDYINNPVTDVAGVDWILAENWWPYQRPSFVTPPFAGYISGHSTYSRAAAEVLTAFTGDEFFPGGVGEFFAPKDNFLVFEKGPSEDMTLQWATYRDASDQCSLSRIWGGIHPPADDLPGRKIGEQIGLDAFEKAEYYFNGAYSGIQSETTCLSAMRLAPNPVYNDLNLISDCEINDGELRIIDVNGRILRTELISNTGRQEINVAELNPGVYVLQYQNAEVQQSIRFIKN